jgi:SAM-dependent methyltransferase
MESNNKETWQSALKEEVEFWRQWFATKGLQWSSDYERRLGKPFELPAYMHGYLPALPWPTPPRILDVGSGPASTLGTLYHGNKVELVPVDPLGKQYDAFLTEYGVEPPVRTLECEAERLTELFAPETFDIAHALNSLDHSYNPVEAIRQMLAVVKTGGYVVLLHGPREAERQEYHGLHQWNFEMRDGKFHLWRLSSDVDLEEEFRSLADIETCPEPGWVALALHKRRQP